MRAAQVRADALFLIEDVSERLQRESAPEASLELLHELARLERLAGLSALLTEADVAELRLRRLRAAAARIALLTSARRHGLMHHRLCCASRLDPFFGCVAAGGFDVARRIAELSPARPIDGEEYAEDFWYAHALHALVRSDAETLFVALDGLAEAEEGGEPPRLLVLRGIHARDQGAFDAALAALIDEHAERFDRKRGTLVRDVMGYAVERHLFVEGAALLVLAEQARLTTGREHRFIPGIARATTPSVQGSIA